MKAVEGLLLNNSSCTTAPAVSVFSQVCRTGLPFQEATWTMEAGHPGDCYFYLRHLAAVLSTPIPKVIFFKYFFDLKDVAEEQDS